MSDSPCFSNAVLVYFIFLDVQWPKHKLPIYQAHGTPPFLGADDLDVQLVAVDNS